MEERGRKRRELNCNQAPTGSAALGRGSREAIPHPFWGGGSGFPALRPSTGQDIQWRSWPHGLWAQTTPAFLVHGLTQDPTSSSSPLNYDTPMSFNCLLASLAAETRLPSFLQVWHLSSHLSSCFREGEHLPRAFHYLLLWPEVEVSSVTK